jgi:hypothetical protein
MAGRIRQIVEGTYNVSRWLPDGPGIIYVLDKDRQFTSMIWRRDHATPNQLEQFRSTSSRSNAVRRSLDSAVTRSPITGTGRGLAVRPRRAFARGRHLAPSRVNFRAKRPPDADRMIIVVSTKNICCESRVPFAKVRAT